MSQLKPIIRVCSIVVASAAIIVACSKGSSSTPEDTSYATEQVVSEQSFNDVENISDAAASVSSGSSISYGAGTANASPCASVTNSNDSIIVDFGNKGCLCGDGRNRKGKIIVRYTGKYFDSGSVHTITFDNFYQDGNKITGTKTVTNMGLNQLGQPYFDVSVNGAVTLSAGGVISVSWSRIRIWTAGYNTLLYQADDVFQVVGSGKMTCTDKSVVNINISDTLVLANACKWVEAGSVTYTFANGTTRSLNYGNTPSCDDQATLSLANGTTRIITLP